VHHEQLVVVPNPPTVLSRLPFHSLAQRTFEIDIAETERFANRGAGRENLTVLEMLRSRINIGIL
jgi:hypothetical protein